jgi:hypothetical protein
MGFTRPPLDFSPLSFFPDPKTQVIRAREMNSHHAPYRQSRLTQVLQESLQGTTCQTTVIGCISPSEKDAQQTLNTLRYAESLKPKPITRPTSAAQRPASAATPHRASMGTATASSTAAANAAARRASIAGSSPSPNAPKARPPAPRPSMVRK